MKKALLCFLWFFVLYFVSCFVFGILLGGIELALGLKEQELISHNKLAGVILLLCIPITIFLTVKGILPWTKNKQIEVVDPSIES